MQTTLPITDVKAFKINALRWANQFPVVCLLDNNEYVENQFHSLEWKLAVDAIDSVKTNSFEALKHFQTNCPETIFGFLTYDLKNELEHLQSTNPDSIQFPALYFFQPRYTIELLGNKAIFNRNYPESIELYEQIIAFDKQPTTHQSIPPLSCKTTKQQYLNNVQKIRAQIEQGDFYELNYCIQFFAENAPINPVEVFIRLNQRAQAPFSTFFKLEQKYLLCASPERFLKKENNTLISQPIKGTIRKGTTPAENDLLKEKLRTDEKERAENVMIVDLVRNDLAKSAKPGTVTVSELFGVYEFNTVHQLISTVKAEIKENLNWLDTIKNAFPMGSMTGTPKVIVMQTIETYETFKRGLYSGSIGYVTECGDFDFNVVIRSILYNAADNYLSVPVGGAITYDSTPENEYQEVLLKAQAMIQVLKAS